MPTRPSPIAAVPALLLVLISAWEVCATRHDATSVPDDAAWDRAAAVVRAGYHAGDLIVFAPDWIDPVGRLHLGDLISVDMAGRMDAARYARIWELSIRGARSPDTAGLTAARSTEVDGIAVRSFARTPVTVVADIREHLADAKVTGGPRPQLVLAEVGFQPHRCLQVTPNAAGEVRIVFPALPLGRELVGYAGLADIFTRRAIRLPGKLEVEIAGHILTSTELGIDDGWVRFATPTTPGPTDVTFIASAGAGARDRLICFAAEARQ